MITFFDTETTGLPKNWKAPIHDLENWPRVIQLAWCIADRSGQELKRRDVLIKPDGWTIPDGYDGKDASFWITHGFNTQISEKDGVPMSEALAEFIADIEKTTYLVSHNMDFDHKVLGAEMIRYGHRAEHRPVRICTKDESTAFCKIPFPGRKDTRSWVKQNYKWPKLEELYLKLFGHDFENKHQAGGDVAALRDCFFELVRLDIIKLNA